MKLNHEPFLAVNACRIVWLTFYKVMGFLGCDGESFELSSEIVSGWHHAVEMLFCLAVLEMVDRLNAKDMDGGVWQLVFAHLDCNQVEQARAVAQVRAWKTRISG